MILAGGKTADIDRQQVSFHPAAFDVTSIRKKLGSVKRRLIGR
jgi:hypothetical protein